MDVRILGAVEIRPEGVDTDVASVGGPRQRRILAALALWHDTVVSIDRLVEVTWPDEDPPARADRNVRTYVHRIRNALPAPVAARLVTKAPGYLLHLESGELDADRFEDGLAEAERLRDRGDAAGALGRVDEAMGQWRGAPLAEFAGEDWARGEVARLEEAHVGGLELRCELLVGLDRSSAALASLEQLIDEHPFRERPRALQMRALYLAGRQAEALRAFQAFRDLLIDEVGVTPSPELVDLDRRIAAGGSVASDVADAIRGYEVHELIGSGAFADVHRGIQPSLGREVAIKSIRAELANQPDFIRGFEAEASMIARLEHPHIVPLYDFWREPDRACLVMRWLAGGSLEASLDGGPWSPAHVVTMVDQVGGALALAHRAGVVHRDVKSANILLDESGNAYLSDFGIAVEAAGAENPAARLSAGSPAYASPEQLRREAVGPASDIHGLAIAAFEALTGILPFHDAQDEPTLLRRQLHDPIPPASSLRPTLPTRLDDVLARATAKDPRDRQATVEEFVADFAAAFGDPVDAEWVVGVGTGTVVSGLVDNPYLGLRAFDEGDAATFFGRDRLVGELVDRLGAGIRGDQLLAVVGPSGSGKSSVVRAGLLPALRGGAVDGSEDWFITTMTPGAHPYEALEAALLRVAVNPPASLLEQLRGDKRGLIRGARRILPTEDGVALVVIDQFEELFTLCADENERSAFLDALTVAVTDADSPLRVVLTLRADFYDHPLRHAGFAELIKQQTVAVTPLAADELELAITGPARAAGAAFEPGLVAEIVADVAREPAALPLMQHALRELYDARVSGMMLRSTYDELGGLSGALGRRAEELHDGLDPAGQAAARRIFGRLVSLGEGSEDTRRRVRRSELGDGAAIEAVLDAFGSARLLSFDRDPATREPTVEVAHEALIREWPRLQSWLDEDRDGLRVQRAVNEAAERWEASGRDPGDLLRGGRLEVAAEYAGGGELTATERELVTASVRARDAEAQRTQRTNRRLRGLSMAVSLVAVLALVAGTLALVQQRRAADDRDAAEQAQAEAEASQAEAEVARTRAEALADDLEVQRDAAQAAAAAAVTSRMAGAAVTRVEEDPRLGALLAAEAYHRDASPETVGALQRTLLRVEGVQGYLGAADRVYYDVAWAGDTGRLVAVTDAGVEVYDASTRGLVQSVAVPPPRTDRGGRAIAAGPRVAFAVSADGRWAALAHDGGVVSVIDVGDGTVRGFEHDRDVAALAFSNAGDRLATGDVEGDVRLWDVASGTAELELVAHPEDGGQLDFRDELVDAGFMDPQAIERANPGAAQISRRGVSGLVFSADDRSLITTDTPIVRVWDTGDGSKEAEHLVRTGPSRFLPGDAWVFVDGIFRLHPTDPDVVVVAGRNNLFQFDWRTGAGEQSPIPTDTADTNASQAGAAVLNDGTWWVSLSDGRLRATRDDGPLALTVEHGLPQPAAVAAHPDQRSVAVAGAGGIALVPLDGDRPLARAIARLPTSDWLTVSQDGNVVVESNFLSGPARMHVDDGSGGFAEQPYPEDLRPFVADVFALVDPPLLLTLQPAAGSFEVEATLSELDGTARRSVTGGGLGLAMSPDGSTVAVGAGINAREVRLIRFAGLSEIRRFEEIPSTANGPDFIVSLSFDAPGRRLLVATQSGLTAMWDVTTGDTLQPPADIGAAKLVSFSPDGRFLATVDLDGVVTLRDPDSFEGVRVLAGSEVPLDLPAPLVWSEDGSLLLGAFGAQPRLWDVETGRLIGDPFPNDPVTRQRPASFALVTGVGPHALVWNLDVDSWPDVACLVAGRNMTQAEWEQFGPAGEPYRATCPQFAPGA